MMIDDQPDRTAGPEPSIDARHAQGVQIGPNNTQHNHHYGPVVRSAYLEQVRRIAPAILHDREGELAQLATFCTGARQGPYLGWQADAGAGKTALLSWFVLNPPPGVRVVSFFVTTRYAGQGDRGAFIDVVLEQLAELLSRSMPAHLTEATRDPHLLGMLAEAAEACRRRGQRLVLVVDGLDEDRRAGTGPGSHSIAALLPARPVAGMRIIVAGRSGSPVPVDVPDRHPLRDRSVWRTLRRFTDPAEVARREKETAARAEERERREEERRRAEQAQLEKEQRVREWTAAEAERTRPAARVGATGRALTVTAGWTLALTLAVWLTWGLHDAGIGWILTLQVLAAGAGAASGLVPRAARLGSAYRPALGTPAAWLPRSRAAVIGGVAVLPFAALSGAIAHDYLAERHDRLASPLGGVLPTFGELVALGFVLLAIVVCAGAGRYAALLAVQPWEELHRSRERAHRAARAEARAAAAAEDSAALAADALSPNPADRAGAYREMLTRLGGTAGRKPPRRS